jgi:hypothetical protein
LYKGHVEVEKKEDALDKEAKLCAAKFDAEISNTRTQ